MLEQTRNLFILIGITALTVLVIHYLSTHTKYQNGWLHRIGNLLSYGWLKICISIGHAKEYVHLKLDNIFCHCPSDNPRAKELHQKEQQLHHMKTQIEGNYPSYTKKSEYNLKILR